MGDSVSELVNALAVADDCTPTELEYVLHDHIDMDAIESLIRHASNSWTLSFEVPDHSVTITGDGVVLVDGEGVETELSA